MTLLLAKVTQYILTKPTHSAKGEYGGRAIHQIYDYLPKCKSGPKILNVEKLGPFKINYKHHYYLVT